MSQANEGLALTVVAACFSDLIARLDSLGSGTNEIIAVDTEAASCAEQLELLGRDQVNHYIREPQLDFAFYVTIKKLLSGDVFGLEKYLPAAPTRRLRIASYAGRERALDAVMRAANGDNLPRPRREDISKASEELLINALYAAPIDSDGKWMFRDIEPLARLTPSSPKPVSLRYASTDRSFAVAVRNRFGRLKKDRIIDVLRSADSDAVAPGSRVLGTGRGLLRVLEAATTVAFSIAFGSVSEVVATFCRDQEPRRAIGFFGHQAEQEDVSRDA